ncbi:uncharacterized protein BXIN_1826 [Babesia sp. Xinjiang]|uniref:uncharacterized protein n=1 Tax=Babesia sp. Xinjiang TaxID=462227 RepID=UPI000A2591BD|nr:uncharacterized protein BXIN_1826 [Babesia sp. Xinjiang]ORM40427.1 hypothetical protein BXIN_1826 [Babesia sp. Xinjiang]
MAPTSAVSPDMAMASHKSLEIQNLAQGLQEDMRDLLMSASVLIYYNYMLKYDSLKHKGALRHPPKAPNASVYIKRFSEVNFAEVLAALRKTERDNKNQGILNHLKSVRDERHHKELLDLKARLASKIVEHSRLRRACLQKAKETVAPLNTPYFNTYLECVEEEYNLTEESENLRGRYDKLLAMLADLKALYERCVDQMPRSVKK